MKIKNVVALLIVIIYIIGCGKVNIKKTGIGKTVVKETGTKKNNIKETGIKDTRSIANNSSVDPSEETYTENNIKETVIKDTLSNTNNLTVNPSKETYTENNKNQHKQSNSYEEKGTASFISDEYDGKMTASGVRYDRDKMTAAHPYLPFDTKVLVTNLRNKRTAELIIIDRFPPAKDRILNVSHRAAVELDLIESGIAKISIKIIGNSD